MAVKLKVRNRIKELRYIKAKDISPNKHNWRTHPEFQKNALRAILAEVGIVDALIAYEQNGNLCYIDGHLRAETEPETEWPVLVLDVTEEEAKKLVLSFDHLGELAEFDEDILENLVGLVQFDSEILNELRNRLAEDKGIVAPDFNPVGADEQSELDSKSKVKCPNCEYEFEP